MAEKNKISNGPLDSIKSWFNKLTGKTVSSNQTTQQSSQVTQQSTPETKPVSPSTNDEVYFVGETGEQSSFASDFQSAEKFTKSILQRLKERIPTPKPGTANSRIDAHDSATSTAANVIQNDNNKPEMLSNKTLGKVLRIFVIIVLALIFIYILVTLGRQFINSRGNGNQNGQNGEELTPSPTPLNDYEPFVPSLYSRDPQVLQIEEDVEVLDRELFNSTIRETQLTPPNLDFNINFQQ